MASKSFTKSDWRKIRKEMKSGLGKYGVPDRVYGSVVLASFNIRKLGKVSKRNDATWQFLADVCRHFDLLAIQEVQSDLAGLKELQKRMGPAYGLIVSDKTGAFPGDRGLTERLGFIFNWSIVNRTEVVTDIAYNRTKVVDNIYENNADIQRAFAKFEMKLDEYNRKTRKRKPFIEWPTFISFIRSPFGVGFRVTGHPGTKPYEFLAINAHLYYGKTLDDRRQEFDALMDWIHGRIMENDATDPPNIILLGDLNLDFNNPVKDRKAIEAHLKTFNDKSGKAVNVNFPFLNKHKGQKTIFRTNARESETFDQIGLFCRDDRFPTFDKNTTMGDEPRGPDYGMFNFVELFSQALYKKSSSKLTKRQKKSFYPKFEHNISDHMPLWLRLPLP